MFFQTALQEYSASFVSLLIAIIDTEKNHLAVGNEIETVMITVIIWLVTITLQAK